MRRFLVAVLFVSLSLAACGGGGGADEHAPVAQATQGVSRVSSTIGGTPVQADNANGGTITIGQQGQTNVDTGRAGTFFDVAPKGAAQTICRGVDPFQTPPQVPGGPVAKPAQNIFAEATSVDSTKKLGTVTWTVEPLTVDLTKIFADGKLRYSDGIDGHTEKVVISESTVMVVFEQVPLSRGGTLFGLTAEDATPGSFRLVLGRVVYKDGTEAPIGAGTSTMTTVIKCA